MASVIQCCAITPRRASRVRARLDGLLEPELLKALAEPTRGRLLSCLLKCGRPCSVTEVAECCSIDFSMVSRHLSMMARAGLLSSRKKGRTVWYTADGAALARRFRELAEAIEELGPGGGCGCGSCREVGREVGGEVGGLAGGGGVSRGRGGRTGAGAGSALPSEGAMS